MGVLVAIAQIEETLATVQWALDLLNARGDTDQAFVLARLQYAASLRASWPTNLIPLANALATLAKDQGVKLSAVERTRLDETAQTLKRLCS